ncbi:MAG: M20 family metallopeptidase [Euryarchaeota archaeon]|nr:M20 family metallopeptidase [Euryarchaeota archaeon]
MKEIDELKPMLYELSKEIFENPETAYEEYKASKLLSETLEKEGFEVKKDICNIETAFKAQYGEGKVKIAFLAEYDALPGVGHGCGHNIIAAAALGAGMALKRAIEKKNLDATVYVIGCPAEEAEGAKVLFAEKGVFDDVDLALMIHPGNKTLITEHFLAIKELRFKFYGKPSHAAASPEEGINALDGVIQTFNSINALRQHLREDVRIHGIITHGGDAPNIVPKYAEAYFFVRATDNEYLEETLKKVKNCAKGASTATGAELTIEEGKGYKAFYPNKVLADLFEKHLRSMDITIDEPDEFGGQGSSDIGNVSCVVPSLHPFIRITEEELRGHSQEFARAAISGKGNEAILIGAEAMVLTALDIIEETKLLKEVKDTFLPR